MRWRPCGPRDRSTNRFVDNLTHTLFGFTLSRTRLERAGRGITAALLLASNAPDIDIVTTLDGGRLTYLAQHRNATHGLLGAALLAVVTASVVYLFLRLRRRAGKRPPPGAGPDASFAALLGVSLVGVVGHLAMDFCTSYGVRILSPFRPTWYAFDWLPIIDIYLWAILGAAAVTMVLRPARRRRIATTALVLTVAWYGVRATAHQAALRQVAARDAAAGIEPCTPSAAPGGASWFHPESWPGRARPKVIAPDGPAAPAAAREASPAAQVPCLVQAAAMPMFLSPFDWRVVERFPDAYELTDINVSADLFPWLGPSQPKVRETLRYPDQYGPDVTAAAAARPAKIFLAFARFPAARTFATHGHVFVHWTDVRFAGGVSSLTAPRPPGDLFGATVELDANGRILNARLGGD
jgi:membrane-bound metal-dependent hydrolase YbcI (DUF457 family)